jgi:PBP1b-binding outer membrane lipoprotein LpoB
MMTLKLTPAIAAALLVTGCSNEPAATPEAETEAPVETAATNAPADADDDTLEPEAPKVEEGEEHNEDAPHSH